MRRWRKAKTDGLKEQKKQKSTCIASSLNDYLEKLNYSALTTKEADEYHETVRKITTLP